jgi:D-glycero-alpha-D-manno-heptose-7-phosphate kinase
MGMLDTPSGIVKLRMRIIAEAPCRVDLAGGTLDIWPLYLFHPGSVTVNFAINRYTRCAIETLDSPEIRLRSNDLDTTENFGSLAELDRTPRPRLSLAAHLLRFFRPRTGLVMHTDSEAPAGAGIAGSSALMIACSSVLNRLTGSGHNLEKIREIAQNVEAQIIRVPTGVQDYYPALYGGVSAIELGAAGVRRVAIPVDLDDFNHRIVLCYTGAPRNSGINNWEVTKAYIDGSSKVHRNFARIAAIASGMRAAIGKADWNEAGRLLREEWSHRRKNAPGISTPVIDRFITLARRAGALGAKVCGAGGGGCVFFLVERGAQERVSRAIRKAGGEILCVQVAARGVTIRKGRGVGFNGSAAGRTG